MLGHRGGRTGLGWGWSLARRLIWFSRGLNEIMCAWHVVEVQKILFPFLFLPYSWHRHLPRDWDQKCGRLILVFPVLDPAQAESPGADATKWEKGTIETKRGKWSSGSWQSASDLSLFFGGVGQQEPGWRVFCDLPTCRAGGQMSAS